MIRFRNILVHLYARIEADKLYDIIQSNIDDFDKFDTEIVGYLREAE